MPSPEPDEAIIEAWLAGTLPPESAERIERYFENHPEVVDSAAVKCDLSLYRGLSGALDAGDTVMIARVKSGLALGSPRLKEDSWKEILAPTEREGILGILGDYEVTAVIATGGMATVLKGYDPVLKRHAALKVLSPEMAANTTARERFLREARAAARLEHEHVLPVYGVHDESVPWFAMRHVDGETLQERIDRGVVFSPAELRSIACQMAAALEAAHAEGIVHRDIKPANVLFDGDSDRLWVCDFGIARCSEDPSLTYPGAIAGTPHFMSPEQARGEELDGASDLFSLGSVLHLAATGRHPFAGETTTSVLHRIEDHRPANLATAGRNLPVWFRRLLANLLTKDRNERPASATEVLACLRNERADRSFETLRRMRRIGWTALASAGALLGILAALRTPPLQDFVNRQLAAWHDEAFVIRGRLGAHSSLGQALRNAKDGDVIELPGNSLVTLDGLEIPPGKHLTLVSSSLENRAVLTKVIAGNPGLRVRSGLRLVGTDAILKASDHGSALFVADGGKIEFEDCRIRTELSGFGEFPVALEAAVEMRGGASLSVESSDFDLLRANAIVIGDGSSQIAVRNSRLRAGRIFRTPGQGNPPAEIKVEIETSEFSGELFILSESGDAVPLLTVEALDSRFDLDQALCWFRTGRLGLVEERVRWIGEGNSHSSEAGWIMVDERTDHQRPRFCFSVERLSDGSRPPPSGSVELAETGEVFPSLKEGIEATSGNATLLLRGRLECPEIVYGEIDQRIVLQAAPGASPLVVSTHRDEHALFLRGPTRISGIRFERSDSNGDSLPIVGLLSEESEVVIEDCVFAQPVTVADADGSPGSPNLSSALGITGTKRATIRRCRFRGGSALWLAFVNYRGYDDLEIQLEDCVFDNARGLRLHTSIPDCRISLRMKRCVGLLDDFAEILEGSERTRASFDLSDCLVDARDSWFRTEEPSLARFLERIDWTGAGNVFRAEVPVSVPALPPGGVGQDLRQSLQAAGRIVEAPLDRAVLGQGPVGVADLREALSSEAPQAALDTLGLFDP